MLMRVEMPLNTYGANRINQMWGSLLHGALIELMPTELATVFHLQGLRPYSQHITRCNDGSFRWVLCGLTEDMCNLINNTVISRLPDIWKIRQKNQEIEIGAPILIKKSSYKEIADSIFHSDEIDKSFKLQLQSPTTFKSDGAHVLFPSASLIMNSLMMRWDEFSPNLAVGDSEVRKHLAEYVRIRDYRLSSASYSVDSSWLKGFYGTIVFSLGGPDALRRIALMLLKYSEFSGLGVKTTLGMGGVNHD
jgi:CRISPR-associated endoribonuclease Cas6